MKHLYQPRAIRRFEWYTLAVAFTLLAALGIYSSASAQSITLPPGFNDNEVTTVTQPVAMDVAPDGRIFFAQKNGAIRVIKNGAVLPTAFLTRPVNFNRERGMIGVALDPNFAQNQYVYIRYTTSGTTCEHILERVTAQGDVMQPGSGVILMNIGVCSSAGAHNAGTIHFGAGGKLFTSVGDQAISTNSQSFGNLYGKLLRLNPDGTIPTDNPFPSATGNNRAIWALGLRNPFVFAVQPGTGQILINDVGLSSWEEINSGIRGANYGWPTCEGNCNPPNSSFVDPIYAYPHTEGCSITGGAFYNPTVNNFPASYTGKYFFTDLCGGWIRTLDVSNGTVANFATGFTPNVGQPVDLDLDLNGTLYMMIQRWDPASDSSLHRIQVSNLPGISRNPRNATVSAGNPVTFTVIASGNGPYSFQWQRNGANIAGATTPILTFNAATADNGARYRVIVSNGAGNVTSKIATLTVQSSGNTPPTPTITLPTDGTHYRAGDTISFAGTGTDAQDGDLPASAFTWEIIFHHVDHTHTFINPIVGVKSGTFDIPLLDEIDSNTWYRIHLTVKDAQGLTGTTYRDILPFKSTITLDTNPSGLEVTLDGGLVTAPYSVVAVENQPRTLGVITPQSANGITYKWDSWSDGGAATHSISIPQNDQTYTATFTRIADAIFADGFEGGTLLRWSPQWTDGGDLSVSAAATLVEGFGMQALIDDNTALSVVDETPESETRYRARFYFDPNSINMAAGDSHVLFFGYSDTGYQRPVVAVQLRYYIGNNSYQLRAGLAGDDTTWRYGSWVDISDAPHFAEFDWHAASGPGFSDGALGFWVDGVQYSSLTGVDNDTLRVDRARLGPSSGIDSGTRGTTFFDGFMSSRTEYIGPAVGGVVAAAEGINVDPAQLNFFTDEPEPAEYTQEPTQEPDVTREDVYLPFLGR